MIIIFAFDIFLPYAIIILLCERCDFMNITTHYKIGLRTVKTGIAVGLSMYIASLFNLKSPIFVGIGAIMAMQSSVSESFIMGKNRMIGTFVGALTGLLFSYFLPQNYLFLGIGIIVVIYIHNLFGWNSSLTLSAIVFLAIFLNSESARIPYATNRLLDTFIGITVSVLVNYFIAAPNIKKTFLDAKIHLYEISKDLIYNLVNNQGEINLEDFSKEFESLEEKFSLYKQDLDLNVSKSKISESSISILTMLEDIYNDLQTIFKLDMRPILNKKNAELFGKIYSKEFIPCTRLTEESDIVYNYHLNKILNNLIEINRLLKENSGS